jgi:hypothetical protein
VARKDAEFALFSWQGDELRLPGKYGLLGTDDVDVNGGHVSLFQVTATEAAVTISSSLL